MDQITCRHCGSKEKVSVQGYETGIGWYPACDPCWDKKFEELLNEEVCSCGTPGCTFGCLPGEAS